MATSKSGKSSIALILGTAAVNRDYADPISR
jgi:hypothetical protein